MSISASITYARKNKWNQIETKNIFERIDNWISVSCANKFVLQRRDALTEIFTRGYIFCSRAWYLRKTELSKIEFTVTILIYLTAIAISEEFEIFRVRPFGEDGWIFARDSFKIPPSLCNQGGMNCAHFNAHTKSACYCSCPYREATFMFDRSVWRCLSNLRARQLLGT